MRDPGRMSNVVIKRRQDAEREMNGAESRKIGQEAGGRMKTENGPRYQETEIVSYVQVINKAEIDRYLQRGRKKKCVMAHTGWKGRRRRRQGESWDRSFPKIKIKKKGSEGKRDVAEKAKRG